MTGLLTCSYGGPAQPVRWRACGLEDLLNLRGQLGRDPFWLARFNRPLADAIAEAQPPLPDLDGDGRCDNNSCFT
jgi:hypothetical protein